MCNWLGCLEPTFVATAADTALSFGRIVFNTLCFWCVMPKVHPALSVASYPSELTVPLLLQQFPSPVGHPPPLNTPPMLGRGVRNKRAKIDVL